MRLCPACGAEVKDDEGVCSICDFVFKAGADEPSESKPGETSISKKLDEMRNRIRLIPKGRSAEPPVAPEPEPKSPDDEEKPEMEEMASDREIEEGRDETAPEEEIPRPEELSQEPEAVPMEESQGEDIAIEEKPEGEYAEEMTEQVEDYEAIGAQEFPPSDEKSFEGEVIATAEEEPALAIEKLGYKIHQPGTVVRKKGAGKKVVAAVIIVILILFSVWYVYFYDQSVPVIPFVDGNFDEWVDVVEYHPLINSDDPDLDFFGSAVQYYEGQIFWYLSTFDLFPSTSQITTYALLIDADGLSNTGFMFMEYFGADMMVTIMGSGGMRLSETVLRFTGGDQMNWSAWTTAISSLQVGSKWEEIETAFPIPSGVSFMDESARFISIAYDGVHTPSMTPFFSLSPGVLVVTQESRISPLGDVDRSVGEEIMSLNLRGYGARFSIEAIYPEMTNISLSGHLSTPSQEMDQSTRLSVMADTTTIESGTFISCWVTPESFQTEYPSIMIFGDPAFGYMEEIPANMVIDGIFGDWTYLDSDEDINVSISNNDINITRLDHEQDTNYLYFYTQVIGDMFSGALIPEGKKILGPENQIIDTISVSTDRITGEDIFRIYIDIDPSDNGSGAPSPSGDFEIYPDYLIEIRGRNGLITAQKFSIWNDNWDEATSSSLAVDSHGSKVEVGLSKSGLDDLSGAVALITLSDWCTNSDSSPLISI